MGSLAKQLNAIAEDRELIEVGRKALEDLLVEMRDERISTPLAANGLVIKEVDGRSSSMIRVTTPEAITLAIKAIAKHLNGTDNG